MHLLLSGIVGSVAYGLAGPAPTWTGSVSSPPRRWPSTACGHPGSRWSAPTRTSPCTRPASSARLALSGNPTATELAWLPEDCYETRTDLGDRLIAIRSAFLSAPRVRDAYLGYAGQQFRKLSHPRLDGRPRPAAHGQARPAPGPAAAPGADSLRHRRAGDPARRPGVVPGVRRTGGGRRAGRGGALVAEAERDFARLRTPLPDRPDEATGGSAGCATSAPRTCRRRGTTSVVEEAGDPVPQVGAVGPERRRAGRTRAGWRGAARRRAARRPATGCRSSPAQPITRAGAVTAASARGVRSGAWSGRVGQARRPARRAAAGRAVGAGTPNRPGCCVPTGGSSSRDHVGHGRGVAARPPRRAGRSAVRRATGPAAGRARRAGRRPARSKRSGLSASSRQSAPAPRLAPNARVAPLEVGDRPQVTGEVEVAPRAGRRVGAAVPTELEEDLAAGRPRCRTAGWWRCRCPARARTR